MSNSVTEYPSTINVVQRFNIYPEVVVAVLYELYMYIAQLLNISTTVCYPSILGEAGMRDMTVPYVAVLWF